jgi:hypothetical protein
MNLFNRIFMVLLCLALVGAAIGISVLTWTIPEDSIQWLRESADWLDDHNQDSEKIVLTAVAGVIGFLTLMIALLQLMPQSSSEVKVTDLKAGGAVLSTAAISQRVEEAVRGVPHVAEVRSNVKAKRKGVLVSLDLLVDPEANLADVTDQACQVVQDVLTNRVHVALAEPPRVRLHYRERGRRQQLRPVETRAPEPTPLTPLPPPESEPVATVEEAREEEGHREGEEVAVGTNAGGDEKESQERERQSQV